MALHAWPTVTNRNVAQPSRVRLSTAPEAGADVYDVTPIPGTVVNEGTLINQALFDQMGQYVKEHDIPIHTTTGTGAAYAVSVPVWSNLTQTELDGHILCIIPNVASTTVSPTLNMNGLGAKPIYAPGGSSTSDRGNLPIASYLTANVPVYLIYNKSGDCWITLNAATTPVATNTTVGTVKPDTSTVTISSDGTLTSNAKDEIAAQHERDQLEFANALICNKSGTLVNVDNAWGVKALKVGVDGEAVQDGTPTPDAPVEIDVVDSPVVVQATGKNLSGYPYKTFTAPAIKTINGVTFEAKPDGTIVANGTATENADVDLKWGNTVVSVKGLDVNISGCPQGGSGTTYLLRAQGSKDNKVFNMEAHDHGTGATISGANFIRTYIRIAAGTTANNLVFKPQIEIGSAATSYEPYTSNQQTITLPPDHNYLASLPDGTHDELVLRSDGVAVLVEWVGKRVFNGSEAWNLLSGVTYGFRLRDTTLSADYHQLICDRYTVREFASTSKTQGVTADPQFAPNLFCFRDTTIAQTVDAWKSKLAASNVTIYYKLAVTATRYSADNGATWSTIDPAAGNSAIQLYKGTNNVWCTDALSPTVDLDYVQDTNKVIDKLRASIVLPPASATTLGGVKVGSGLSVTADGTLSSNSAITFPVSISQGGTGANTAPLAANSMQLKGLGGGYAVMPDGSDLNTFTTPGNYGCALDISAKTILNTPRSSAQAFNLTVERSLQAGGGRHYLRQTYKEWCYPGTENSGIQDAATYMRVTSNGGTTWGPWRVVSTPMYATTHSPGFVKIDGSTITIDSDGIISAVGGGGSGSGYVLPPASASTLGGIKVGSNLSITADGVLSATDTKYTLPPATKTILGGVKVGDGINVSDDGTMSVTAVSYPISVANGGTGANTAAAALVNLGITMGTAAAPSTGTAGSIYIQYT